MEQKPTLVIMAAGIGSRFGGLKQVEGVGPHGELVIDYSIADALQAGFGKIVFLIRRDIEEVFREKVGRAIEKKAEVAYAFQDLQALPPGFPLPPERKKPWGTGHAVLSCKDVVHGPFAVINADDFYGRTAFFALADTLRSAQDLPTGELDGCMAGYVLGNTLSEYGSVARGVCQVSPQGFLSAIHEVTRIQRINGSVQCSDDGVSWTPLAETSTVSMNMWGFTPGIFAELEARFPDFLRANAHNLGKAEYFLPNVVGSLIQEGRMRVKVLPVDAKWFGVTYPADLPLVRSAIASLAQSQGYFK